MKIVTNGYGMYAIKRSWWRGGDYYDMRFPGFWWDKNSHYFNHCWTTDFERVKKTYNFLNAKEFKVPVDEM